jgi:hypothetical protein
MVRICSSSITEHFRARLDCRQSDVVGSLGLSICEVIAATIVVGLFWLLYRLDYMPGLVFPHVQNILRAKVGIINISRRISIFFNLGTGKF